MALPIHDEELKVTLDAIFAKEIHELTGNDKGILKARRDYIDKRNREKFKSVLEEKGVPTSDEGKPEEDNKQLDFPGDKPSDDDGVDE